MTNGDLMVSWLVLGEVLSLSSQVASEAADDFAFEFSFGYEVSEVCDGGLNQTHLSDRSWNCPESKCLLICEDSLSLGG